MQNNHLIDVINIHYNIINRTSMIQWAPLQDSSAVKLQKLPSEPRDSTAFGARLDDPKRMFNQIGSPKKEDYIGKHVIS